MAYASPRFLPGATTLLSCLEPAHQTTLHTLMRGAGATPQAVTLSSSTTLKLCVDIQVRVTGTGILGAATAEYQVNQDGWVAFTIDAVVPLAGWPFSLGFPAGTYTLLDTYRSVIGTVVDDLGNVFDGASASAAVRPYVGEVTGGFPAIETNGADSFVQTTTNTLSTAMIGGTDRAFYWIGVGQYIGDLTPAISATMVSFCDGSASGAAFWDFGVNPTGFWRSRKRGDAGGTVINESAVAATGDLAIFEFQQSGTTITARVSNVTVLNAVSQNVGVTTCQFVKIGQLSVAGLPPNDTYGAVKWCAHAMYAGVPSATLRAYYYQNYKVAFAIP